MPWIDTALPNDRGMYCQINANLWSRFRTSQLLLILDSSSSSSSIPSLLFCYPGVYPVTINDGIIYAFSISCMTGPLYKQMSTQRRQTMTKEWTYRRSRRSSCLWWRAPCGGPPWSRRTPWAASDCRGPETVDGRMTHLSQQYDSSFLILGRCWRGLWFYALAYRDRIYS